MNLEAGKKYKRQNEVVEIKFIDRDGHGWGLSKDDRAQCVYHDYEWQEVTDKPDPGEGWRLLHPDEDVEEGDEYFDTSHRVWLIAIENEQYRDRSYRRRIAPQYVPYTWEDRGELRGRWYRKKGDNSEFMVCYITRHNESEICIGPWRAYEFLGGCEWLDGTPCGKVVT